MFTAVLSSVLPVCLLALLGAALRQTRFLPELFFAHLNRLGFWLLLPSLLFCTIATAPAAAGGAGLRIGLVLCACAVGITLAGWLVARLLRLPEGSARALMQASMRGNLAYTALPVLLYTFGEGSAEAAAAAMALAPTIPFYNFLAVLVLTHTDGSTWQARTARAAGSVLRNPLILGCGLGLLVLKSGIVLPAAGFRAVEALGRAALPCALLALGAGLTPAALRTRAKPALAAAALKLLVMPALGYLVARAAGFSGETMLITLLYLASPCAVTSYVMADQMGADKELAGSAIALSTLLCLPVMVVILLLFR